MIRENNLDAGKTWVWIYDDAGNILSKKEYAYTTGALTGSGTTTSYVYGDAEWGDLLTSYNGKAITYDANGRPMTVMFADATSGSIATYYYVTNLQGDVVAILDSTGTAVVTYTYDAWGNVLTTGGSMSSTLGLRNPLRYRGYVYDHETELYYLQSRYYNPEWGRFINADVFLSTGQGLAGNNMFVYCGNNPIMCTDTTGAFFFTAMGALTGFIASAATAMLTGEPQEKWLDIAIAGAIGGDVAGAGVDAALLVIGSFGTALPVVALAGGMAFMAGGIGNVYTTYATSGGTASGDDMMVSFLIGGVLNAVSLGTSTSAIASSVDELIFLAMNNANGNLITGLIISESTGIATWLGTTIAE